MLLLVAAIGVLVMWRVVHKTDQDLRSALLKQARICAQALNIERLSFLSGSEEDLNSHHYQRLKVQLDRMRRATLECRFLYLMGQHANGEVFFYVDSLPVTSEDYAPPGMVYREVSNAYLHAFDSKQENVVGPVTDRWGTLVSALIPVVSPHTGRLVAILGMDVDASDWNRKIFNKVVFPFVAILFLAGLVITLVAREQSAVALHESEKRFKDISMSMADWIWEIDKNGRYTYISGNVRQALGYQPEEIIGKTPFSFKSEAETEKILKIFKSVSAEKRPIVDLESWSFTKMGKQICVLTNGVPLLSAQGRLLGYRGVDKDITARKNAEQALRESERHYRNFFDNALAGLFRSRLSDGLIIEINAKAAELLDLSIEEIVGKVRTADLYRNSAQRRELVSKLKQNNEIHGFQVDMTLHNGREVSFSISVKADPHQDYMEGAVIDITEFKQAVAERARLQDHYRQAQKVEAIGRLAGGVAHDLNNLLSPILGYGEILLDDLGPNDGHRQPVNEIVQAGFRARDLVRQLLAFSRKQTLEYMPVDMNRVIENFYQLLRRTIREDIEIQIRPSSDLQTVMADSGQIELVIMNLAVNAADAMPQGGRLTIETAAADLDEEYAATHPTVKPGAYVMLAVSDTGSGMDEQTREQIFDPFFSTKGDQGTGLGLATVYGIVKQHNGNIWVYSEPGKGTAFKIYLPASGKTCIERQVGEKTATEPKGFATILLVEDNEQVRDLTHSILKRQAYTVLVAENGAEALAILESHEGPVDILLTDVVMPAMNGKDLFSRVAEKYPDMRVLYMSGYTENVIAHQGVLDEGVQFIQKPFTVQGLIAKVREVLEQH